MLTGDPRLQILSPKVPFGPDSDSWQDAAQSSPAEHLVRDQPIDHLLVRQQVFGFDIGVMHSSAL